MGKWGEPRAMGHFDLEQLRELHGFWYLGSPYTKHQQGLDAAFFDVARVNDALASLGVSLFSPIVAGHAVCAASGRDPRQAHLWMTCHRPIMERAGGLIIMCMEGWEQSDGLREEIDFFAQQGRPMMALKPHVYGPWLREREHRMRTFQLHGARIA
jgi:hypothetical protein